MGVQRQLQARKGLEDFSDGSSEWIYLPASVDDLLAEYSDNFPRLKIKKRVVFFEFIFIIALTIFSLTKAIWNKKTCNEAFGEIIEIVQISGAEGKSNFQNWKSWVSQNTPSVLWYASWTTLISAAFVAGFFFGVHFLQIHDEFLKSYHENESKSSADTPLGNHTNRRLLKKF